MFAPAKTPDDLVERMNKAVVAAIRMPDVRERLITVGLNPTGTSAAELGQIQRTAAKTWEPVIKASGFMAD
jgi:tripartite-type tricarboxylate transporter receptor subunit TctC